MKPFNLSLILAFLTSLSWAGQQSYYCPQNHAYISIGMTAAQVIAACGPPFSVQKSNKPLMERIPMKELYYVNQGAATAFYGVWALPIGNSNATGVIQPFGSNTGGAQLQVNIINDKISSIYINSTAANAFSICTGSQLQIGDPIDLVYNSCGTPSLVNETYVNQPMNNGAEAEMWIYQMNGYQPSINLTFVKGKLQSID